MMYLVFHTHTMLDSLRQMKCLKSAAPCRQITCSRTWTNPSLLQLIRTFLSFIAVRINQDVSLNFL
uniref:Uncharacterized protein n=1 Tax=Brassica campestris TaxID=3711 RepID=A0A3P5YY99_BRACM|nr:unnamed protein product [Brassica rapa]